MLTCRQNPAAWLMRARRSEANGIQGEDLGGPQAYGGGTAMRAGSFQTRPPRMQDTLGFVRSQEKCDAFPKQIPSPCRL